MRHRPATLIAYVVLLVFGGTAALVMWGNLSNSAGNEALRWGHPGAFGLLGACVLLTWVLFHLRWQRAAALSYSRVQDVALPRRGLIASLATVPAVLRIIAIGFIAVALARPQTFKTEKVKGEGIDIMIIFDLSESMKGDDLRPTRLYAGQRTIRRFLARRDGDRIGLVVFAREAMLQCPLTLDYHSLDRIVADLEIGDVPEMGTAIGDGLGLALASLRRSSAKSKVAILISDGDSNVANAMDPHEAKELAHRMGVRVFTVLMGEEGLLGGRNQHAVNPELLRSIANDTGGLFFNAGDDSELEKSFDEIRSTLEKSETETTMVTPHAELFPHLVAAAVVLLFLEITLAMSRWRRFP